MASETDTSALDELGRQLGDARFRRAFSENPERALEEAGIEETGLPPDFVAALAELSTTELRLVGHLAALLQGTSGAGTMGDRPKALQFPF